MLMLRIISADERLAEPLPARPPRQPRIAELAGAERQHLVERLVDAGDGHQRASSKIDEVSSPNDPRVGASLDQDAAQAPFVQCGENRGWSNPALWSRHADALDPCR